jgi:hypothetical protein
MKASPAFAADRRFAFAPFLFISDGFYDIPNEKPFRYKVMKRLLVQKHILISTPPPSFLLKNNKIHL